jgi:hypothetical protein
MSSYPATCPGSFTSTVTGEQRCYLEGYAPVDGQSWNDYCQKCRAGAEAADERAVDAALENAGALR